MPERPRLVAWVEPGQVTLLGDAIREADLELVAIGSPTPGAADVLSTALDAERCGDLRLALRREDVDLLWLADARPLAPDERRLIRDAGLRAITTEPRPMAIGDLLLDADETATATFVPLLRRSPAFLAAADALAEFGPRQCINVAVASGSGEGSLFARLFDAVDLLEAIGGVAETVDAAHAGPRSGVPESLADLNGHLTMNVRYAEDRCACLSASNAAGGWSRRVCVLGPGGCLRIDDAGYAWTGPDGTVLEEHGGGETLTPGALVGRQITRLLGNLDAGSPPSDDARLLALCEAARLSCRTGQGETPGRLLEMRSRP